MDFREHWIPVKEDPDYEVSNLGNVRRRKDGRLLSQSLSREGGYLQVYLNRRKYYTHRIVYHAFFNCDISKLAVKHRDGDRTNNILANLEAVKRG